MDYTIRPIQPGVMETTTAMPSERVSHAESFVARLGENDHQFVAVATGPDGAEQVLGSAGINVYSGRKRHSAGLGIMVHRDYQDLGIGTALLEKVLDIADNWLGLARVELTVFADNARAIHLYEKHGFEREGLRRMSTLRAGQYCDDLLMARLRFPK